MVYLLCFTCESDLLIYKLSGNALGLVGGSCLCVRLAFIRTVYHTIPEIYIYFLLQAHFILQSPVESIFKIF